ncbi:MAG: PAS domain S-box protein [Rhodospirillales bacterium]|nr:PAS domain S-box protein [Rhodospirillales bacterium]
MSLTLYSRAMLWIGASLAAVTALSTYLAIQERRADLTEILHARLQEASSQQAIAVSDALWKLNKEGTEIVLQGLARDPDFLAVRVLDETGRVFASVGTNDIPTTLTERSEAPIVLTDGDSERRIGTLELYFSHSRLEAIQRDFLWEASQLGLLQLVAVLLATALALRAVIKPLEAITDRMLTLASGDLTSPIAFKDRPDQVGNIARAVQVFAREMDARRQTTLQLELAQQHLERRIEERTRDLRESEERFRDLFQNSPLAKWVYSVKTLRFLEVNDAAILEYGYSRQEFHSMTLKDIRPPEDIERLDQWLQRPENERLHAKDWRHLCKDGKISDVEIFLRDIEFGGEPARLAEIIDVTARKEAERQTQRIFETSQDVILVTDSHGTFLQVSPSSAMVLGYQPEEMTGHPGDDFIFPEDLESTREEMQAARSASVARQFKCRYVHKDGQIVSLLWKTVWSEPDRRYFFIGRDMTEYERTADQLRQAQKMEAVGQLTGGVAHDFNNILMVIMANVEALEEDQKLDPEAIDRIRGIDKASQRATDLTRQLLAFSRKQALRPQRTNINDLVVATGKLLRRTLGEQIEIECILADDLWDADIDRAQLDSALVNLSINARDAMPEGGRLLIETGNATLDEDYIAREAETAVGDYVRLTVTDTGKGIPPSLLDRVFEPFFTTKAAGKGTGLGLSMVYGFVKQSKGHIKIYSEVGRGTSIKLYLPRSVGQEEQPATRQGPPMSRGNERIFIVEDDAQVRGAVVRQLQSLGYVTSEAPDGEAGLAAFEAASQPYDLLLTDVIMPGPINGRALADEVKRRWPTTKVVFMSGYTEDAIIHHGRLDAGVLLLNKPFRKNDLAQIIRNALDGSGDPGH